MTISELTLKSSDDEPVRRFEVFTGTVRQRDWLDDDKAGIVAKSYEPGATVSAIVRRHALSPQQLFGLPQETPMFVLAVIDAARPAPAPTKQPAARRRRIVASPTHASWSSASAAQTRLLHRPHL